MKRPEAQIPLWLPECLWELDYKIPVTEAEQNIVKLNAVDPLWKVVIKVAKLQGLLFTVDKLF